jgi:hypothetical protein
MANAIHSIIIEEPSLRHGFVVVPNFLFGLKMLSHGARLTYILLLKYAWQENSCFPGVQRLAEHLAVERKSVIRYTGELVTSGLISIERRGQGHTNIYHLNRWVAQQETPAAPLLLEDKTNSIAQGRSPIDGTSESPNRGTSKSPTGGTQILFSRQVPSRIESVNAIEANAEKEPKHAQYLVDEILKVCRDPKSTGFYRRVAAQLDDSLIFRFLAEIRHDAAIRNKGAIFVSKVKAWRNKHTSS